MQIGQNPELNAAEQCWNHAKYADQANFIPGDLPSGASADFDEASRSIRSSAVEVSFQSARNSRLNPSKLRTDSRFPVRIRLRLRLSGGSDGPHILGKLGNFGTVKDPDLESVRDLPWFATLVN